MKNIIVGTKLDPKVKVGNGYFKTPNETAESIKKKVESKLKGMIRVQVFVDSNGEKYRIPTWTYFTKRQLRTKKIQLRMTPPYLLKNETN